MKQKSLSSLFETYNSKLKIRKLRMATHNRELPLVHSNVRNMIIETESGQFKYTFHFIRLVCSETILVYKMKGDEQRVLSYKNFEF